MIRNYFKIALRSLWKNKGISTIHIIGLITGISCCLLMIVYIQHELSYDTFQEKGDRIVRTIMEYGDTKDNVVKGNFTGTKVLPAFRANFPEVEDGVRMYKEPTVVRLDTDVYNEKRFLYADSSFFRMFSFPLLKGNPANVLNAPYKVVLSASASQKYFGNLNPVGQTIRVGPNEKEYLITGVAADCPDNSQIRFDFMASFTSLKNARTEPIYWSANYTTYLLLNAPDAINSLRPKIIPFMKREMAAEDDDNFYLNYDLEPFNQIHLHSPYDSFEPNTNIKYLYISGSVALLILIIACFTYINISTARSLERAREVGIRKVTGAYRHQIFWQFIGESAIITALAIVCSIGMCLLLLPAFGNLIGQNLAASELWHPKICLAIIGIQIGISLLAGSYPALVLSRFSSIKVLKGSFHRSNSGRWLKGSLIVFQFVISGFLVIATLIIQNQLHYIRNKDMGYNREHVLVLPMDNKIKNKLDILKKEWKQHPDIVAVSMAASLPTNILGGYSAWGNTIAEKQSIMIRGNVIDEEYIPATGLQLLAGKNLTEQDVKDASYNDEDKNYFHFILNETATAAFGWTPEEAVGKRIVISGRPGEIRGVVRDFNYTSLHTAIQPLVLFPENWGENLLVKTSGTNLPATLNFIHKQWQRSVTHRPFEYRFMNEDFDSLYKSETRIGKILSLFTGITIVLACLGLFGLSAYTIRQRTREIGIRKVLGAPITGIVGLLSSYFLKLVLLAFIIASPLAWFTMNSWLQDFVYRTEIHWWIFAITAGLAVAITLVTVSFQSVKAALSNPVKAIKTEG